MRSLGARNIVPPKQIPQNKTDKTPKNYKKTITNPKNNFQTNPQKSIDNITNVESGKLTQTSILAFVNKGVKRKGETQLAPQWTKKLNTRIVFKPWSRRAKATHIKMVKDIITDVLGNMFPTPISPIFAHLVSYNNLGKVSKEPVDLRKV